MLIQKNTYPEFVPDQILSSEHLNSLFEYLDEEQRLTRVNLLGTGIVCGLEVKLNAQATELTITKGSGITSEGYLVSCIDKVYTGYQDYDLNQEIKYDPFTHIFDENPNSGFKALELTTASSGTGIKSLNTLSLGDYVVMMLVELKSKKEQECTTGNCDGIGTNITVNLKPLLILKSFAPLFISGAAGTSAGLVKLPEVALRRFDVTATGLSGSAAIIEGYRSVISGQLQPLSDALSAAFVSLYPFISDEFSINPFPELLDEIFSFLKDNTYPLNETIHIQYYYDLLADLYNVYNNIREHGDQLIGVCNPDSGMFPRHLLLGPALNTVADGSRLENRTYFMPSGAIKSCCSEIGDLRIEFKRLILMLRNFALPLVYTDNVDAQTQGEITQPEIRITPDLIGDVPLSDRSIPFYYEPNDLDSSEKLFRYWNYAKTHAGHADRNLSYNANKYRSSSIADDPILKPLYYDIEPYNFLRVEGGNGKSYREAVNKILDLRDQYRLPFEVIALRSTAPAETLLKKMCCGDGLELSYDIVRREWEAVVGETINFIQANKQAAISLIDSDGNATQDYLDLLDDVKGYLVEDVSTFMPKYEKFIADYEKVEMQSEHLRDIVYARLDGSDKFAEDLIDHLDAMAHSNKKGPFRALHQAFEGLSIGIEQTLTISEYFKMHPGITHKAGVPVGGTLVLVYHTVENTVAARSTSVDNVLAKIPEGTVIADFYLPYLCCSDCSPIAVTIGDGKPASVKPTLSIEGDISEICLGDPNTKTQYKLSVAPSTTTVSATVDGVNVTGVLTGNGSSGWYFNPGAISFTDAETKKVVNFTAQNDGQSVSLQVAVYAKPVLNFTIASGINANQKIFQLTGSKHVGSSVTWYFGDNASITSPSGAPISHDYPSKDSPATYSASVTASNGSCQVQTSAAQTVSIASSLPCNGQTRTCKFIWPHPSVIEMQYKDVSYKLNILRYTVDGKSFFVPSAATAIPVSSANFSSVWQGVVSKLNSMYGSYSTALKFGNNPEAYLQGGYPVQVTGYACLNFEFEFEVTLLLDGRQYYYNHYRFSSLRGTESVNSLGDAKFIYRDPNCNSDMANAQQNAVR